MSKKNIKVPNIGEFKDVEVIEILVKKGQEIKKNDPLITIESDKSSVEIPATDEGNILELNVKVGDKVSEGDKILEINTKDKLEKEIKSDLVKKENFEKIDEEKILDVKKKSDNENIIVKEFSGLTSASPKARKFARELGVDINKVKGSERDGRVIDNDIKLFVSKKSKQIKKIDSQKDEKNELEYAHSEFGEIEIKDIPRVKKLSSKYLINSWSKIPHVTNHDEADITEMEEFRNSLTNMYTGERKKITPLAFIVKALSVTLKKFPNFNSSIDEIDSGKITIKKYYHIGIAVDTPHGLMVPKLRNVKDKKDVKDINKELGFIEDQLLSIASQLKGAIVNALEDVKDESKQVAEVLAGDVDKAIKSLAKGLDETVKNQQKLTQGTLKSADIQRQILDRAAKREIIERKLQSLSKQGLDEDIRDQKLAELNEAEEFHNEQLKIQFDLAKAIEERIGAIGGIVKGISKIPIIGELINADEVMAKIQKKAAETEGSFAKLEIAAYGFGQLLGSAFDTLTDPTVVFGAILKSAGEIEKQQKQFRSLTGQNVDISNALGMEFLTTGEYIKSASMLSKELGVNAAVVFSPETIKEVAELTENMGLGAHEAAQLAKFAKLSGKPLSEVSSNMEASFKSFVGQEKVGLNFKDVMDDVGSASAAVTLSLGSNPAKIQEAAMEARKLGLSLEQVDNIAGSLLDFESSIAAEMEAELLTGKQLNLEKARQAALNNDLATLSEEIGKNEGILKAFSTGNRIQQEATAKALGTGINQGVNWKNIEIVNYKSGKPKVILYGEAHAKLEQLVPKNMKSKISITISDEKGLAQSLVIIEAI